MRVVDPPSPPPPNLRSLLYLLAGIALGVGLGVELAQPGPTTPSSLAPPPPRGRPAAKEQPAKRTAAELTRPDSAEPVERRTETPSSPTPPSEALRSTLALTQHELRELARALSDPGSYRTVRALRRDLRAWEAVVSRREGLLEAASGEVVREPLPELPEGLRDRVAALNANEHGLLVPVVGGAESSSYLPPLGPSSADVGVGVLLHDTQGVRRVSWRVRTAGVERQVEVSEQAGRDLLTVRIQQGRGGIVRTSQLGEGGAVWRMLLAALVLRGEVQGEVLSDLLTTPLEGCPPLGWLGWLRRSLELPHNPDFAEPAGAPAALPAANPLLLREEGANPVLLQRPDLRLDPVSGDPPTPARGPLVLIASNGLGVYDGGWSWLVFDPQGRRVVHHMRTASGHVRWELTPDPTRVAAGREAQYLAALGRTAEERTGQALSLISLRRELAALHAELRGKVGGLYTRDGLGAVRLRAQIIRRTERVQALSHLLLGPRAIDRADRAVAEAKRQTTATLVELIEAMIDAGRSGPVEYLLRDEEVKGILFSAPQAYRLRIVRKFNDRFRPLGSTLWRSLTGDTPRWYESE